MAYPMRGIHMYTVVAILTVYKHEHVKVENNHSETSIEPNVTINCCL